MCIRDRVSTQSTGESKRSFHMGGCTSKDKDEHEAREPAPPRAEAAGSIEASKCAVGGMSGIVYGEPENDRLGILHDNKPWEVMANVAVVDLGQCINPSCLNEKKVHIYNIDVKCLKSTTIAELQERIQFRLVENTTSNAAHPFSQKDNVKLTSVPRLAPDWTDVARPDQTVGEVEEMYGASKSDEPSQRSRPHWDGKPGIRFYATTGPPTAEVGFAFWELDLDPKNPPWVTLIHNDGLLGAYDDQTPRV
eukprot:TRINITY_DN11602_c0_g1_i2.p1 TRINITY_DN11602_c0_g1~~TRINITY_DN11602_c0_g1_i2.p1  ORF type:complete len:250 (-),score=34.79 TRINITY_DN11602_c0_g1_i2:276-1025(-)